MSTMMVSANSFQDGWIARPKAAALGSRVFSVAKCEKLWLQLVSVAVREAFSILRDRGEPLRRLDSMCRTVFVLRDMEQMSVEQVATILDGSLAAVGLCLLKARLQLREMLAHQMKGATVSADIQIRAIGPPQRELLIAMYDRFDPLGAALGLPPRTAEARREWTGGALRHPMNVAAFSPAGEVVGHCFLVPDKPSSAEMAVFVHQGYRRRGLGATLLKETLKWGAEAGLRRVWAVTASDNRPALRLQISCGFGLAQSDGSVTEMEINLPIPCGAGELA
jgi:GNAT superfamily N-acetyltransferase